MAAVAGLAAALSVETKDWPFVTVDAFHMLANSARLNSGAIFLTLNPIVQAADLAAWESYVQSSANSWM